MDNYITIPTSECVDFGHIVKKWCIPNLTNCDNTVEGGYLTYNEWNCNKVCAMDQEYIHPIPYYGTFMFQTNFNTGRTPKNGWNDTVICKLYDAVTNQMISDDVNTFASRYVVAHSGKYAYQTIEINTVSIPSECFYFTIEFNGDIIQTQLFKKERCDSLIPISGLHKGYDCYNNYYGLASGIAIGSDFSYDNRIYLKGIVKYFGTEDGKEITRIHSSNLVPPYVEKYISNKILTAKTSRIYDEVYLNKSQSFTPRENTSMFQLVIEFERDVCNIACN